ncbi:FAD-dependent monooxygenase [Micrococcales bacterium 31B]|nr:FAD-dependent monooxygenase [Micrococcales bacterium 31B]
MKTVETDVLVVGAGPAGLTAALLLATYGVRALTVTKYGGTANSPRAHITNQRTVEVFRDLGIEEKIRAVATPNSLMGHNVWATSFAGDEIARLMTWGSGIERGADYALASPSEMCNIPQHVMEPVLLDAALERGAEIRFSTELIDITQDDADVTALVRQRETGEEYLVRAKYAIGADGGRSLVAEQCGFTLQGEMGLGAAVNVWLEADLTTYTEHRPGTLYWMNQPGNDYWVGSGTWICVKPWTEWVLLYMYDPSEGEPDMSVEAVTARAHATIGDDSVPVTIKAVNTWQINHVVAERYRKGRVFLAGDAAHRHPPANGLGTNTSVQDSFNLAWKLAFVLRGLAGDALLDSYDEERQPVGRQVVDRAMQSVADMLPISQALGFAPGQSSEDGWSSLAELFSATPAGESRRAQLREAVQLQNYQFNAHGVEMGQRYESGAVVADGTDWPVYTRDRELYYHPTTHPGAALPHAWVQRGTERVSTLDLVGRGRFTLLVGPADAGWADAGADLARELDLPLDVVAVGARCSADDVYGEWAERREISDAGALLVRPDRHIAWRALAGADDPRAALRDALAQALVQPQFAELQGA